MAGIDSEFSVDFLFHQSTVSVIEQFTVARDFQKEGTLSGKEGSKLYYPDGKVIPVEGFPVEVLNILGAGDGYTGGFLYGYIQGWDHIKCCRLANACGAYLVTQPGCANFSPTLSQINEFIEERGGY